MYTFFLALCHIHKASSSTYRHSFQVCNVISTKHDSPRSKEHPQSLWHVEWFLVSLESLVAIVGHESFFRESRRIWSELATTRCCCRKARHWSPCPRQVRQTNSCTRSKSQQHLGVGKFCCVSELFSLRLKDRSGLRPSVMLSCCQYPSSRRTATNSTLINTRSRLTSALDLHFGNAHVKM